MHAPSSLSPFFLAGAALLLGSCAGSFGHNPVVCQARSPLSPGRTYYYVIREESRTFSDEKGEKVSRENGVFLALHCTASPDAPASGGGNAPGGDATGGSAPGGDAPRGGNATAPAHLRIVCDSLALHEHSDDDELDMDAGSALESPDPGVRMLAAFDGAELDGRMDGAGKLLDLSGLNRVYGRMQDLGQEPGEDHSGQAITWERRLDKAFFNGLLEKAWHIYPDAEARTDAAVRTGAQALTDADGPTGAGKDGGLAIGDSWVLPDTLDADSHIPLETTYTLVRLRNGILHFTTLAKVDIRERKLDNTYRNGQVTLKGKQAGFLDIDAATGMVLDGKSTLMAEGSLRMGEVSIPLIIDSTYTVSAS